MVKILITGAGGFIGHHLVKYFKNKGYWVRGADLKYPLYEKTNADEFEILDLRLFENCLRATRNIDEVYALAADMGGIGFISANKPDIMRNNTFIDFYTIEAARINGAKRFFYSSSACIYPLHKQKETDITPLKESDAYPADAEDGYGWQKLFMERQCKHYYDEYGLEVRIARFHNVFGPLGTYEGGREKAPAAVSRKIALAHNSGEIEIWGDGKQTRSFCYIDDCVDGIFRIAQSNHREPINLGSNRLVTIDELVDIVAKIANKKIIKNHNLSKPQGVRGRNSDNTKLYEVCGWEPQIPLEIGLEKTYRWIEMEIKKRSL